MPPGVKTDLTAELSEGGASLITTDELLKQSFASLRAGTLEIRNIRDSVGVQWRTGDLDRADGQGRNHVHHLLRCGCCDQAVEIYYDTDGLEINGVNGSLENWREVLLPLLGITQPDERRGKAVTSRKKM